MRTDPKKKKEPVPQWKIDSQYDGHRVFESILEMHGSDMDEQKYVLDKLRLSLDTQVQKSWASTNASLKKTEAKAKAVNDQFQDIILQELRLAELEAELKIVNGKCCKTFGFLWCC